MHIQPLVPARSCFILPSAPMSMIVASRKMDGGAALIARAIFAASELPPPLFAIASCPDAPLGASFGVFYASSAAASAHAMLCRPATVAMVLRIVALREVNRRRA